MKKHIYILALSVSFLLAACSSNEQDISPLSPQLEKTAPINQNFPFSYLQSFAEMKNVKIDYKQGKGGVYLEINSSLENNSFQERPVQLFAVVDVGEKQNPKMVFLGNSLVKKYFIPNLSLDTKFSIRLYTSENQKQFTTAAPYPASQEFKNITVRGWSASNTDIKVSSSKFPAGLKHLYVELKTKQGSFLVFLGKPSSEDFEIPKYGSLGISDLRLFGYTLTFTDN